MSSQTLSLPFDGEYRRSSSKRFHEVIVFIHHFGGHKHSTKRHQEMVLKAGYDCVTFNLYYHSQEKLSPRERLSNLLEHFLSGRRNLFEQWVKQLDLILDQIPGDKVIYSLSSPSTAAVGSIGLRQRKDVKAWICDGGPFLDLWKCFWNYNRYESKLTHLVPLTLFNTLGFLMFGGLTYRAKMRRWLLRFPKDFPILNLRAAQDQLVPPSAIQKFFSLSNQLSPEVHVFSHSDHLSAIKTERETYEKTVLTFLQKISSVLETSNE